MRTLAIVLSSVAALGAAERAVAGEVAALPDDRKDEIAAVAGVTDAGEQQSNASEASDTVNEAAPETKKPESPQPQAQSSFGPLQSGDKK